MELFRKIRLKIGTVILSQIAARTKKNLFYTKFSEVKTIGIVWDASRTLEFPSLSRFHQRMLDKKIEIRIIGYFPGKNLPDQYTAIRYLTCVKKDELNFFYHPDTKDAHSFINTTFDILIDINFDRQFPLQYITALSKARLKVGLAADENVVKFFDLMINIKKPVDLDNYLDQVVYYLEMIKNDANLAEDKKAIR